MSSVGMCHPCPLIIFLIPSAQLFIYDYPIITNYMHTNYHRIKGPKDITNLIRNEMEKNPTDYP
jgi:hypothetical protein